MVDISLKDTISEEKADVQEDSRYEMKISYDETQKLFADYKDE